MTNKEFIDTLIVSGKVNSTVLREVMVESCIQRIKYNTRFIGNEYKKLLEYGMNPEDAFMILDVLVLKFDLDINETAILAKRMELVKEHLGKNYREQTFNIHQQFLKNKKSKKSVLYRCEIELSKIRDIIDYIDKDTNGNLYVKYRIQIDNGLVIVIDNKGSIIGGKLKYILLGNSGGTAVITSYNFDKSMYNKHKNNYKIVFKVRS